jgi:hypothetical protein
MQFNSTFTTEETLKNGDRSSVDPDTLTKIFINLKAYKCDYVDLKEFKGRFQKMGIRSNDPRFADMFSMLDQMPQKITKEMLGEIIQDHEDFVVKVLREDFIMPDFQNFKGEVKDLYEKCKLNTSGKNADYIPELANANPNNWGVSICTVDGQQLSFGDTQENFSV